MCSDSCIGIELNPLDSNCCHVAADGKGKINMTVVLINMMLAQTVIEKLCSLALSMLGFDLYIK